MKNNEFPEVILPYVRDMLCIYDYCLPNVFFHKGKVTGFIDLGRAGISDKCQDIALCVRSLEHNLKNKKYTDLLFQCLNIEPNYEKINYYILLDELF